MKDNKFKERCNELINDTEFNSKYCVYDILHRNIKIIFLLESPHNEEIKCKYPLAGKSGINITKFICKVLGVSIPNSCDKIVPFGKLVQDAHNVKISDKDFIKLYGNSDLRKKLKKIGIMNVCNIPMQMSAYCYEDIKKHCEILKILDFLREQANFTKNRKKPDKDNKIYIQEILKKTLCSKISNYKKTLIVPMGDLALAYLKQCNSLPNKNIFLVDNKPIPHPSPRNTEWSEIDNLDFSNSLKKLESKLKDVLLKKT